MLKMRRTRGHQHSWKGVAKDALKDPAALSESTELEREVLDQYVGGMTHAQKMAESFRISVGEGKAIMREIRDK